MEQREASEAVMSLVPDMGDKDPGDVLINYAKRRKLAPAQFQKMAQVFNTCSTLYGQSVDRNEIPELIDAPALVEKYIRDVGTSKLKAASAFFSREEPADETLEKVASPSSVTREEVPYIWSEAPAKAAAQNRAPDPKAERQDYFIKLKSHAEAAIKGVDKYASSSSDFLQSLDAMVGAIKTSIRNGSGQNVMARAERDARAFMDPPLAKAAFNMIAGHARRAGVKSVRFDEEDLGDSVVGRDTTGLLDKVKAVQDNFFKTAAAYEDFKRHSGEVVKLAHQAPADGLKRAQSIIDGLRKRSSMLEGALKIAAPQKKVNEETYQRDSGTSSKNFRRVGQSLSEIRRGVSQMESDDLEKREVGNEKVFGVVSLPSEFLADSSDILADTVKAPLDLINELGGADGQLDKNLRFYSEEYKKKKDREQKELYSFEEDVESMANLKRLMATDEVISEFPTERVVEVFNSIRLASPEVASDPSMLRLQLRQGLQTQGYDIDSATASRKFETEKAKAKKLTHQDD